MTSFKQLKQLLEIAKELKKQLALATLFGSLGHLTLVVFTFLLVLLFLNSITTIVILLILILIVLSVLKGFFSYTEQLLNHYVAFKILHVLRVKVLDKFRRISIDSFMKNSSGDYMTMITTDIELLEVFYAHTITPFLIYIIQSLVVSMFVSFYSLKLAILTLLLYIIIGLVYPLTFKNKGQRVGDTYRKHLSEINNNSSEEAYGIFETIQYDKVEETKENLEKETNILIRSSYNKSKFQIDLNAINIVTYNISIILFIFFASKFIENPNYIISLTAAYIVSFIPILYMGNLASTLSQTMASGKRFLELMNMEDENQKEGSKPEFNQIKIENLSFAYGEKEILHNISFTGNKGEIIGISGESGSGKSTLAKLIMKFYPYKNGNIYIDDIPLHDIDNDYFRNNSSIIMQDTYLFNASLINNLNFFDKNIDKNKLDYSLSSTNLKNFVNSLPKKEYNVIGERSSNISSGQKQRLSVARSFYNDSKLLILDEATANIDIFSEIELLKALEENKKDKIIIIISHNKSTLSICDKVIKL